MNKKVVLVVISLMVIAVVAVGSAANSDVLHADDGETAFTFLPFVSRAFAPQLELFVKGLGDGVITDIVDPGDGRLFIATRDGRIQVSAADGTLQGALLNIQDKVYDDGNEMGFVGLAVHPDFAANGQIFVFYTEAKITEANELLKHAVVARYIVGANGQADPATEERILHIELPTERHHSGAMHFGPQDGYLYIAIGDGGTGRDSAGNGQSKETLLGKILRIDVDSGSPYAIPLDNPFVSDENSRGEIWALGLRNPWRISFDRQTGDMFIGDVGEETWEEINYIPAGSGGGQNFGWSCLEGPDVFNPDACEEGAEYIAPIYAYLHQRGGECSVTAGYMYRGAQIPELAGQFLLADLCSTKLISLRSDGAGGWTARNFGRYGYFFTTFGERSDGELFIGAEKHIFQIVGVNGGG